MQRINVLTFDVEDWFHLLDNPATEDQSTWDSRESRVERNVDRILGFLADHEIRATFFCLGWIALKYPGVISKINAAGYEIGSHSFAHRQVSHESPFGFAEDLRRSIRVLEDATGKKVRAYRAPGFSITRSNSWAFDILIANGIEIDCSLSRSHFNSRAQGFAQGPLWLKCGAGRLKEFPLSQAHFGGMDLTCASSGYFRLLPYRLIRAHLSRCRYSMSYFHPRDFDVGQPIPEHISPLRKLKSGIGQHSAMAKLGRMVEDFSFVDLQQATEKTDWSVTKCLNTLEPDDWISREIAFESFERP